jgi:hypothetical protein
MRNSIAGLVVAMLTAASAQGEDVTFKDVQADFRQKVLSLVAETNASANDLQTKIAEFADATFGAHPDVMRTETERRFKALPQFTNTNLTGYVEHKTLGEFPVPPAELRGLWLMLGWDPEKLAGSAKNIILGRSAGIEVFRSRSLLGAYCPDITYRLGDSKLPDIVVDSLGDLFVVKVEMMPEAGVCKSVSVRWLKRKEARTTPSTVPPPAPGAGGVQ